MAEEHGTRDGKAITLDLDQGEVGVGGAGTLSWESRRRISLSPRVVCMDFAVPL
jgi:hypothetical protein